MATGSASKDRPLSPRDGLDQPITQQPGGRVDSRRPVHRGLVCAVADHFDQANRNAEVRADTGKGRTLHIDEVRDAGELGSALRILDEAVPVAKTVPSPSGRSQDATVG